MVLFVKNIIKNINSVVCDLCEVCIMGTYVGWLDSRIKNMRWLDIAMVKWSVAAFILLIAKLWPPLLSLDWYWYLIIGVLTMIRPLYTMFKR